MKDLTFLIKRYVLGRWPAILYATGLSFVLTVLETAPLIFLMAILHVLTKRLGDSVKSNGDVIDVIPEVPWGFDIGAWNGYLTSRLDYLVTDLGELNFVMIATGFYLFAVVANKGVEFVMTFILWRLRCLVNHDISRSLFHHVCNLSMDFFHRNRTGELVSRLTNDTFGIGSEIYSLIFTFFRSLPVAAFYWLVLFNTHFVLSLGIVVLYFVSAGVSYVIGKRMRKALSAANNTLGDVGAKLNEVLGSMLVVKAFNAEVHESDSYGELMDQNFHNAMWVGVWKRTLGTVQSLIQSVTVAIVLMGSVMLTIAGELEFTTFILFFAVLTKVQAPSRELLNIVSKIQSVQGHARRVIKIMNERSSVIDGNQDLETFAQSIEYKDVTFAYDGPDGKSEDETPAAINGVNLTIRKGEVIGIVGTSGSGKSTLVNLMLRFYDPSTGEILLDGKNIKEFNQSKFRRLFGVVTQEPILFNDTISNNIAYAAREEEVDHGRVVEAARLAHADEFIKSWKDGYDTIIGDRGTRLSGGQRQRLTLARALLRNSSVLILDEATSSLDSETEEIIRRALEDYFADRTVLIVAHRLSTLRHVDRIVVIENGRIVEEGSHKELMELGGSYARLSRLQGGTDGGGAPDAVQAEEASVP
jgi:ATP-binding cassette, subfamily B, bacterial MsbA